MIAILPATKPTHPDLTRLDRISMSHPGLNVLKQGFGTPMKSVPEDDESVNQQSRAYFYALCPRNDFHAWLVEDTALCTLRIDRTARVERRERDRLSLRAEFFWDQDRRSDAEATGSRLSKNPAASVRALERTPQGCDWLITQWAMLAHSADKASGTWTEDQTMLAFDLLATPRAFRQGTPGLTIDAYGRPIGEPQNDLAAMARGQVDRLLAVRDSVTEADALDRAMVMADMTDGDSAEIRRIRRYEASLQKRMRWNLSQLQKTPKWVKPHPDLLYLYPEEYIPARQTMTPQEPHPEPTSDIPAPEAEAEAEAKTKTITPPSFPQSRTARVDPFKVMEAARRRNKRKDPNYIRD